MTPAMDRVLCRLLLPADFLRVPTASAVFSVPPTISQHSALSLNGVRMTIAKSLLSVLPPLVLVVLPPPVVLPLPGVPLRVRLVVLPLQEVQVPQEAQVLQPPPVRVVTRLLARPLPLLLPPPQLLPQRQEEPRQAKLEEPRPVEQPRVVQRKQAVVDGKVEAEASEYDDLLELHAVFAGVG